MRRTLTLALSVTMLAACSPASQPAPAKPAAAPAAPAPAATAAPAATVEGNNELENKGVAMMQRMGEMFAADASDCEKLAVDIKAFVVQNRELLIKLTELERSQSDQEKAAFEARNKPAQDAVVAKMDPAMAKCADNPRVQAAMRDFPAD